MNRKWIAAILCAVLCLTLLPSALAAQDYEWTLDDYIWTLQSKRVNGVPIGDALNDAFSEISWQAVQDGDDIYGYCSGGVPGDNFELLVRFTGEFTFEIVDGTRNGETMPNPSQFLLDALGAYQQSHRCDACAGLGYTDACLNCAGTGFAFGSACLACGGSGRYACRTCGGYGVMTNDYTRECPFCEGTGVAGTCSTCGGGGYGMLSGTLMMCTDCLGSGEAVCPWCSAAGIKMGYLRNS